MIDGVPRLVLDGARGTVRSAHPGWFGAELARDLPGWDGSAAAGSDLRLVARFDAEWRTFSRVATEELEGIFRSYFDLVPDESLGEGALVLDAGCGGGRWAYQVQRHGARVIAIDLGRSVEVAERNTRASGRVACVQGDVRQPPLREATFDLVYSLGVLHHIVETDLAVGRLARLLRPGASLLVYLYYALDSRPRPFRAASRLADAVRRVTSALPQPVLLATAAAIAALVYWPLARTAKLLRARGRARLAEQLPLSFYADASFELMRNDSLDRFGTSLQKRYTRAEVRGLLEGAGLRDVVVSPSPPFWHAVARRTS